MRYPEGIPGTLLVLPSNRRRRYCTQPTLEMNPIYAMGSVIASLGHASVECPHTHNRAASLCDSSRNGYHMALGCLKKETERFGNLWKESKGRETAELCV